MKNKLISIVLFLFVVFNSCLVLADLCDSVHIFIVDHYNPLENRLEFTEDDFDLLQMQTTALPSDLEDKIIYYENLCDKDLPFLVYNNEWPEYQEEIQSNVKLTLKEGFERVGDSLKKDAFKIILVVFSVGGVIWVVGKYG